MTVGIVAACKHGGKTAIVLCCDWQGTLGNFIKSEDTDKMRYIGRATVLVAGTLTEADELVFECDAPVKQFLSKTDPTRSDPDVQEYLKGLGDAVARRKSALVKDHIRRTLGIDDRDFWQNGKQYLTTALHDQLLREIMAIDLGTSIIIGATRADDDDVIVRILPSGVVSWGSGARGAEKAKTTRRPQRVSLRIAITLPAASHLEAKRKASSLSMSFSEIYAFADPERSGSRPAMRVWLEISRPANDRVLPPC